MNYKYKTQQNQGINELMCTITSLNKCKIQFLFYMQFFSYSKLKLK